MGHRPRVSAAVLRSEGHEVLMVRHLRSDGSTYWQLPGGGVVSGERPEDAVLRELKEETGLDGTVIRELFTLPYRDGTSTTFLVEAGHVVDAELGSDPEEAGAEHRKLVEVAWQRLDDVRGNPEIAELLGAL